MRTVPPRRHPRTPRAEWLSVSGNRTRSGVACVSMASSTIAAVVGDRPWSVVMSQPSDPTRWLTDLLEAGQKVAWPADAAAGTEALTAKFTEASAQWNKAVTDVTTWQLDTLKAMSAPW